MATISIVVSINGNMIVIIVVETLRSDFIPLLILGKVDSCVVVVYAFSSSIETYALIFSLHEKGYFYL